jgi:uncharacterized protein (TIGR02118 family)
MSKVRLYVAYHQPPELEPFLAHYENVHVGLAKAIPNLESFEWSSLLPSPTGEPATYALIAELTFASMDDFAAGMGSEEGQAAAADVGNFAVNGAEMFVSELKS